MLSPSRPILNNWPPWRKYLIFGKKAGAPAQDLIDAIDDYAEKLTGDRRALHAQGHSIGGSR